MCITDSNITGLLGILYGSCIGYIIPIATSVTDTNVLYRPSNNLAI